MSSSYNLIFWKVFLELKCPSFLVHPFPQFWSFYSALPPFLEFLCKQPPLGRGHKQDTCVLDFWLLCIPPVRLFLWFFKVSFINVPIFTSVHRFNTTFVILQHFSKAFRPLSKISCLKTGRSARLRGGNHLKDLEKRGRKVCCVSIRCLPTPMKL